jgi:hypothetical protein
MGTDLSTLLVGHHNPRMVACYRAACNSSESHNCQRHFNGNSAAHPCTHLLQGQGHWAAALADCGRARALNPTYLRALNRMASILEALRRPAAAAALLRDMRALPSVTPADAQAFDVRQRRAQSLADLDVTADHFKLLGVAECAASVRPRPRRL